jgi:acid phosphatase type 7
MKYQFHKLMKSQNTFVSKSWKITLVLVVLLLSIDMRTSNAQFRSSDKPFFDPVGIYLTWQQDPTTTMTIDWHVIDEKRDELQYRLMGEWHWSSPLKAEKIPFPYSDRTVMRVELTGLDPDSRYEFRFGESSKVYNFRTMPSDLSEPIRIAVGGDTMHRKKWMEKTSRQAMKYDIDFVLILGDLAYADGLHPDEQRHRDPQVPRVKNQWYSWYDAYKSSLISDDYRVVPMVVTIGNHEIRGGYYGRDDRRPNDPPYSDTDEWKLAVAPYFFNLFAMPGLPGYNVLDFSDYLSLVLLDTDHANPVENQNEWLETVLSDRMHVPHVFPSYHVPAFPSVRDYNGRLNVRIRKNWLPIFEKYGVEIAFEAHDHIYKRTHPIREGRIQSNGIVYIGDGSWGTETREIGSRQDYDAWYLASAAEERHFILLTLHGTQRHMKMINSSGKVIDEYPALVVPAH